MGTNILPAVFKETNGKGIELVFPAEYFREVVRRERSRCDRNGQSFSLISFEASTAGDLAFLKESLLPCLLRRVRCTDSVGWIADWHLAVLLPDTPQEGAQVFLRQVIEQAQLDTSAVTYGIVTYPLDHLAFGDNGDLPTIDCTPRPLEPRGSGQPRLHRTGAAPPSSLSFLIGSRIPVWKRALDIAGSLLGLVLLFPLFLLIAAVIKAVSRGPVFYMQDRIGYLGKTFTFWKFRTMKVNADNSNHQEYMQHLINNDIPMNKLDETDKQIIPLGRFLRKSCIDELPQLFNVLLGDMSLVGPRPCLPYEAEKYLRWHARRFDNLPGMTGLWQVSGKNETTFKEMIRLDIRYANEMSFWLDIKILFKTIPSIIRLALAKRPKRLEQAHV